MNMAEYGEEYANSGVAGIADIVAAWSGFVTTSQARGDPQNVTVFGQWARGKITCLFGSKRLTSVSQGHPAKRYIANAPANKFEDSARVAHAVMKELGLTKETIKKIRDIPVDVMNAAYLKVAPG
jgi:carboxylesterase type B